jgi:hypothetical protein
MKPQVNADDVRTANDAQFQLTINANEGVSTTNPVTVQAVPPSFWEGLNQCENGQTVDMDRALQEPPPED